MPRVSPTLSLIDEGWLRIATPWLPHDPRISSEITLPKFLTGGQIEIDTSAALPYATAVLFPIRMDRVDCVSTPETHLTS